MFTKENPMNLLHMSHMMVSDWLFYMETVVTVDLPQTLFKTLFFDACVLGDDLYSCSAYILSTLV